MDRISKGAKPFVDIPDEMQDVPDFIRDAAEKIVEKTGIDPKVLFQSTPRRMTPEEYCEIRRNFADMYMQILEVQAKKEALNIRPINVEILERQKSVADLIHEKIDKELVGDVCEFCNGNTETQQPLPNFDDKSVWTIIPDKKMVSIVTCEMSPRVFTCPMHFCPICGRKF